MLTNEQLKIIDHELKKESADEFIKTIIFKYAIDLNKTSFLLQYIPYLATKQLSLKQRVIDDQNIALNCLIGERYQYPVKKRSSKYVDMYFAHLCLISKARYPHGVCEGSESDEALFTEFIDMIKNKKGFDYEDTESWEYIKIIDAVEWMKLIIKLNVNENFTI